MNVLVFASKGGGSVVPLPLEGRVAAAGWGLFPSTPVELAATPPTPNPSSQGGGERGCALNARLVGSGS